MALYILRKCLPWVVVCKCACIHPHIFPARLEDRARLLSSRFSCHRTSFRQPSEGMCFSIENEIIQADQRWVAENQVEIFEGLPQPEAFHRIRG